MHKVIASGRKLLVVSTKKQASEVVSNLAKETGQYYVNYREIFSYSVAALKELDQKNSDLETKVSELENTIQALENKINNILNEE